MGRIAHQKPGIQVNNSNSLRANKVAKQRHRHKVVLEDLKQNKHKSLYFRSDPPPGYTFIPAGNPELTAALKEFAKKSNQEIFAVTTTPHASRHELSREVHRIGWHFPTEVVARVCAYYGIRLTSSGKLVEDKDDDKLFMKLYQRGQLVLDEKVRDQVTINTEAKQIIRDLFPNIPDNDLFQIIKTAFQLGDGKVGTADEIPLVRRAQLSVVAHVRHTYTNYDKLLRQVPYTEARHLVENETLKKLIDWRGDDEDKAAVEDTLREVVVISDEEDSDDDYDDSQVLATESVKVQLKSNGIMHKSTTGLRQESPIEVYSEEEAPQGFRYVPQVIRRIPLRGQPEIETARQQSRYAVWDRYRQEYRSTVAPESTRVIERILVEDPAESLASRTYVTREPLHVPQEPLIVDSPIRSIQQQSPSTYVRGVDGRMYERIVLAKEPHTGRVTGRRINTPPPIGTSQYVRSRPASPRQYEPRPPPRRRTVSYEGGDGTVVPSIEGSSGIKRRRVEDVPPSPFFRRSAGKLDNNDSRRDNGIYSHPDRTYEQYDLQHPSNVGAVTHDFSPQVNHHQTMRSAPARDSRVPQAEHGNSSYPLLRDSSRAQTWRSADPVNSHRRLYLQADYAEERPFDPRFEAHRNDIRVVREPLTESFSYDRGHMPSGQRTDSGAALNYSSSGARRSVVQDDRYHHQSLPGNIVSQVYPSAYLIHPVSHRDQKQPLSRVTSESHLQRTDQHTPNEYHRYDTDSAGVS